MPPGFYKRRCEPSRIERELKPVTTAVIAVVTGASGFFEPVQQPNKVWQLPPRIAIVCKVGI